MLTPSYANQIQSSSTPSNGGVSRSNNQTYATPEQAKASFAPAPAPKTITQADLHNPMLSGGTGPSATQEVGDQWNQGKKMIEDSWKTNPIEGAMKGLSGGATMITAPAAPLTNAIGKAISTVTNPVSDAISNIPAVQKFANSPAGDVASHAAEDVSNLANTTGTVAGIAALGETPKVNAPEYVGKTSPAEVPMEPPAPPKTPVVDPAIKANVDNTVKSLNKIELGNAATRRVSTAASAKGIDVKNIVANTDLLQGSVDNTGKIDTLSKGGAVDQFNKFMGNYESAVSDGLKKEGIAIPFDKVKATMLDSIKNTKVAGAGKTRLINMVNDEITGLQHDVNPNGTISLSKLQDAKISTTNGIDYTKPETKINAKAMADIYRTLIEDNSKLPVKAVNAELSKYYSVGDYLEALHGKTVQGGKLGRYAAQTVGAIAGSHFGPLGTIIGSELGGLVKGTALESTFGAEIGQELKASPLMQKTIEENNAPPMQLPAPGGANPEINVGGQENNLGNLKNAQSTNMTNNNASTIEPKPTTIGEKSQQPTLKNTMQGGYAKNPIAVLFNKFHPDDQSFLTDFASKVDSKQPIPESMLNRVKETWQHYGYTAPDSKTKLADLIKTASNSAEQKSLNQEMDNNLNK